MRLVIDIPEKIYNDIKSKNEHGIIFNAVKNGTPLNLSEYRQKLNAEIDAIIAEGGKNEDSD